MVRVAACYPYPIHIDKYRSVSYNSFCGKPLQSLFAVLVDNHQQNRTFIFLAWSDPNFSLSIAWVRSHFGAGIAIKDLHRARIVGIILRTKNSY